VALEEPCKKSLVRSSRELPPTTVSRDEYPKPTCGGNVSTKIGVTFSHAAYQPDFGL
jgi:hypothetical protein